LLRARGARRSTKPTTPSDVMSDDLITELRAHLERERRKLELVQDIALAVGSTVDVDELLRRIAENVTELMDAERSTIYAVDREANELWSRVAQSDEEPVEIRLAIGTGIAGWVAARGDVLNVPDAYSDPRFDPTWDQATGYRTRSLLCAPMVTKSGHVIGVVQVLNKKSGAPFTDADETYLQGIAGQAGLSLQNARLVRSLHKNIEELRATKEELENRNAELDLLLELAQVTGTAPNLEELLDRMVRRSAERCNADAGSVVLVDDSAGESKLDATFVVVGKERKRFSVPCRHGVVGWVVENGEPLCIADASHDARCSRTLGALVGYEVRSALCVPIRGHHGILGAIELLNKGGGAAEFTAADEKVLSLIAGQAAQAVELARARERRDREERLATIGHLLSGVLHDLKTPMTVISGYVQLMVQADDVKQRQTYAETVLKQFQYIGSMTAEILTFARGESTILLRRVYLHQFVEEIGELVRKELEARGIRVVVELRYRGTARFDEGKMRRVFYNIARNAAEAMSDGGTFTIEIDRDREFLELRFTDTGVGVPDEVRTRLFESFSTAGKKGGTGLGLAVVKKIVDEHDGTIDFTTETGRGTTFTIRLPIRAEG
jgi:signal transduction histidine kinase